ncbi:MAG: KpsF/GutQ family sugar-phosphate isomerase [Bdellovibrionota bacterium]|jgi:arabinose-5-phosphate isomerase
MSEDCLEYARNLIAEEAAGVQKLSQQLDESFSHAVDLIAEVSNGHGHIVVSGMGKAGFIGMKISATLASVGIPSFFLNPAEAAHGDLGRYTKYDLALIISYSGETEEILRILPLIKRLKCPIVSITATTTSNLAKASDVVLALGNVSEAGPLGLAPTTSAMMMLALGDALAMTIVRGKKFSREEFAFFHSGGSLGKALKPITTIMRQGEMHCIVSETETARAVLEKMTETKGRPGAATVVDSAGKLSGVFTDGNFRRCLSKEVDFLDKPISKVATKDPKTITVDAYASDALQVMSSYKIDQVIVVDSENYPVGLVDIQDLIEVKTVVS